jgi:hypothetical protein
MDSAEPNRCLLWWGAVLAAALSADWFMFILIRVVLRSIWRAL